MYVLPHVTYLFVMRIVVKWEVLEFIRTGVMKKWILLSESLQYFLELVVMYKTEMPCINGMKDVRR